MPESIIPEGVDAEVAAEMQLSADLAASHALDHAGRDEASSRAATAFLASHKRLVDLQIAYFRDERHIYHRAARLKRFSDVLRIAAQTTFVVAALAVAAAIAVLWWSAISSDAVVVEAFDAPESLAGSGLSGTVVAGKMLDALVTMQNATRVAAARHEIEGAWSNRLEIRFPESGVSLAEISQALHSTFGHDVYIDGALVRTQTGGLSLSVRGGGVDPATFTGGADSIDMLTTEAAEYVFGRAEPALYATYLLRSDRVEDCVGFVRSAFPRVTDKARAALANLWGEALLNLNRVPESTDRFRLAIDYDRQYWRAWNNLIGVLPQTASEEAAYRMGMAMMSQPGGLFASQPTLYDKTNFAQLTLDPAAVIAGLQDDRRLAEHEGAEYDYSSWIAEQEAVRHDWGAVSRYLLQSPERDVTTSFDQQRLDGQRELEDGQYAAAVPLFEAADKQWHASPVLQAYFPDFECDLGHAYVLAGRVPEALPLLQDRRFVRCRAFRAEAIDRSEPWAAAERAFKDAEAVAPDLAFAYYQDGAARLRHGDLAGAIPPLDAARQRSPRWADPLKALGDVFARQGRWQEALKRYDDALALTPAWDQLQAARQEAARKAGP